MNKLYKNNNLDVQFSQDEIAKLNDGRYTPLEMLESIIEWSDCYLVGEIFCISNYECGVDIYNTNRDVLYTLRMSDIDRVLLKGKTLKLYAREVDEYERKALMGCRF